MFEKKDSLISIIIALCKLTFILMLLLLYFPVTCSVQAFMVRKLPVNYNETYDIFLGMFTAKNLLMLSIPLEASFNTNDQKICKSTCDVFHKYGIDFNCLWL